MNKLVVKIPEWQLNRPYNFIATVRRELALAGRGIDAYLFDAYAMTEGTNPIAEALKYVELEIKNEG